MRAAPHQIAPGVEEFCDGILKATTRSSGILELGRGPAKREPTNGGSELGVCLGPFGFCFSSPPPVFFFFLGGGGVIKVYLVMFDMLFWGGGLSKFIYSCLIVLFFGGLSSLSFHICFGGGYQSLFVLGLSKFIYSLFFFLGGGIKVDLFN